MKLYAELPLRRGRQLLSDVLVAAGVVGFVVVGMLVHALVSGLADPGRRTADVGGNLAAGLAGAGSRASDLPLVGGPVGGSLSSAADAARQLQGAGIAEQDAANRLALGLALLVTLGGVSYLLGRYLPARWREIRTATAAAQLRDGGANLQLFALRALTNAPLTALARASRYQLLAKVELSSHGLRMPRAKLQ